MNNPEQTTSSLELLTYAEAAEFCRISLRTIQEAVSHHEITVIYVSPRRPKIARSDLTKWLKTKTRRAL